MPPHYIEQLHNGLTVVLLPRSGSHQVLISLMLKAGSRFESPSRNGITHFLEHMLFRGNGAYASPAAMNLAFEQSGSILNAQTGVEETEFFFLAHPQRLDQALAALASFVRNPVFTDLEKERQVILEEMQYDYNAQGSLINLATLASQALWPDHPLGQPVIGTAKTIHALTAEQLRDHQRATLQPGKAIIALAGNLDIGPTLESIHRGFGQWSSSGPESGQCLTAPFQRPQVAACGPEKLIVFDADNQFHLQLSFPAPGYNDPREPALQLLERILDDGPLSRLQRVIREEKALVYHISADHTGYHDAGQFDIATSVKAERLEELLRALLCELEHFRSKGPTAEEVSQARLRYRFEVEFSRDSLAAAIDRHAWPLLYSQALTEAEELKRMEAVSNEELRALGSALLSPNALRLVLVGPTEGGTEALVDRALRSWANGAGAAGS